VMDGKRLQREMGEGVRCSGKASLSMGFSHYARLDAFAQQKLLMEMRGY
jgi:translation elongation factor EF-G